MKRLKLVKRVMSIILCLLMIVGMTPVINKKDVKA